MRQLETPRMNASAEACKNEDENAQFRAISGTSACFKIFKDAIHLTFSDFLIQILLFRSSQQGYHVVMKCGGTNSANSLQCRMGGGVPDPTDI